MKSPSDIMVDGHELPVMETFYSLQGEGRYSGNAAFFIRLGGCDVGCVWCDVKDSWDVNSWPLRTVQDLVSEALKYKSRMVVITGGEPALYDLRPLTNNLHKAGFRTHIETSGSSPLVGVFDWVTFSPKKFKAPLREVAAMANELKVVVFNKSDFHWAEQHAGTVSKNCTLYLQPEWSKRAEMTPYLIQYVAENPQWKVSIQTHKYLMIP